jgi:hypothetical protein
MAGPAVTRRGLLVVLGASIGLFISAQLLLAGQRLLLHVFVDGAWAVASLLAALKALRTSQRVPPGPLRYAWRLFACGCFSWWAGMLIWTASELRGTYTPFPSLADVGFVGLAPWFIAGLVFYRSHQPGLRIELKHAADLGIVLCLMLLLNSVIFYAPLARHHLGPLALFVALVRPVLFYSALVTGLLCFWQQRSGPRGRIVLLLVASLTVLSGVATWYTHGLVTSAYEVGRMLDVFWIVTFCLILWAAHEEDWHAAQPVHSNGTSEAWRAHCLRSASGSCCSLSSPFPRTWCPRCGRS